MGIKCPKCHSENSETASFCADCGTKLISPKGFEVTKTIEVPKDELTRGTIFAGRYEIIEELGKGGMGRVYRAYDKQLEEEVAIKLLKSEIAADKKTLDRFKNEIKLARERFDREDLRLTPPEVYYNLGRLYEKKGLKEKARENYQKFLDIWKDADPGIVEIEDARKRLVGLGGQ